MNTILTTVIIKQLNMFSKKIINYAPKINTTKNIQTLQKLNCKQYQQRLIYSGQTLKTINDCLTSTEISKSKLTLKWICTLTYWIQKNKSYEKYKFQNACISLKILEAGKLYIKIKKKTLII